MVGLRPVTRQVMQDDDQTRNPAQEVDKRIMGPTLAGCLSGRPNRRIGNFCSHGTRGSGTGWGRFGSKAG